MTNTYTVRAGKNRETFTNFKTARACAWNCAKSGAKVILTRKVGNKKMEVLREYVS